MKAKKKGVSAFAITKNEEKDLARALESVKWADEIVLVDGYSTDKTVEIAKKYGARVILSKFAGFDKEKNKAIDACRYSWILEIDADEDFSSGAEKEIRKAIRDSGFSGYSFIRHERFLGRVVIKAPKVRLYRNSGFRYKGYTHEVLQIKGKIGKLRTVLNHYNNPYLVDYLAYSNSLSTREVDRLIKEHKRYSKIQVVWLIMYRPIKAFLMYYLYFGLIFKGLPGLGQSLIGYFHEVSIWLKYYERKFAKIRR